jgi:RNA polymerase sigma factor for flagellar operon FliA
MTHAELAYRENQEAKEDRDQLILEELPQVHYIARRISERLPQHVIFEDLVHAGVVGLIECIRSFDPGKGVPFKAYARFRIRGAILDSLRDLDWGTRPLRREGRRIEEAISKLSMKLGRQPDDQEIADELGTSLEKLYETAVRLDGLILIGQEISPSYDRSEKQDLIESAPSREDGPYERCLSGEVKDQLAAAIETLSEKEQVVVSLYYKDELTMKEIAAVLGLTESRVSQIHSMVLPKIRGYLESTSFDESALDRK